jgi:hypothetical protein
MQSAVKKQMEASMWMLHDRRCGVVRGIAVGSGLLASLAGTTQIPAAIPQHELCTEVVESADGARHDKAALIYGLILDDQQHGVASEHAYKLALRDLRTAVPDGRLPGGPGGPRRPVAVVMCTKGRPEDDAATRRAADHLIKRVGVSAIVTLTTRQALVTQRAIAASGASVLHVCESCATELRAAVEGIGDPSLVFQNAPSRASFSPMILKKLPEFEAHVRERRGFDGSAKIRVALLRPRDDAQSFGRALDETLVINGSPAALQKGTNYLPVDYTTAQMGGGTDRHETAGGAVAAFRPHIVMAVASDREIVAILDAVERRLEPSAPRPLHWGWTPHAGLLDFIGANDERRTRVYSYAPGMPPRPEQRERRNGAAADFAREFPGVPVAVASVFNHYGPPYQIMYAAAAAGALRQGRLTGADLARGIGITQTPGARQVYIGRRDLAAGLDAAAIGPIALQNLHPGHPLNWSQNASGAPMVDHGRIYCFTRNPSTGALVETSAGQVWERKTNALTGTFAACR